MVEMKELLAKVEKLQGTINILLELMVEDADLLEQMAEIIFAASKRNNLVRETTAEVVLH